MQTLAQINDDFWQIVCRPNRGNCTDAFGVILPEYIEVMTTKKHKSEHGVITVDVDTLGGQTVSRFAFTALTWAVLDGHIALVQALLSCGANANRIGLNWDDLTPLKSAMYARRNQLDMMKLLLDNGADASSVLPNGTTCLHWVNSIKPEFGGAEKLRLLLTWIPLDKLQRILNSNAGGPDGPTPLNASITCRFATCNVSKMLIDAGAELNKCSNKVTPLGWCVLYTEFSVMRYLLRKGANIETGAGSAVGTVLNLAVARNKDIAVGLLLDAGADPHVSYPEGIPRLRPPIQRMFDDFERDVQNEIALQRERRTAFAMSEQQRLGIDSSARTLPIEIMRLVIETTREYNRDDREEAIKIMTARRD
jgi:hypothetical protein